MSDEQIIPAVDDPNPGTEDGAGERVEQGLGSGGIQRIEGEFGDLEHGARALAGEQDVAAS